MIKQIFLHSNNAGFERGTLLSSKYIGMKVIMSNVAGNTKANSIPDVTPTSEIIRDRFGIEMAIRTKWVTLL